MGAERQAELEHAPRPAWHSLRRSFATTHRHRPLEDPCAPGGWKDHDTIRTRYVHADENALREAPAMRATGSG